MPRDTLNPFDANDPSHEILWNQVVPHTSANHRSWYAMIQVGVCRRHCMEASERFVLFSYVVLCFIVIKPLEAEEAQPRLHP